MKTLMAGVNGVVKPGDEYDASEADAIELIFGGFADRVGIPDVVETASLINPEYAANHFERKRRKRQ